MRKILQICHLGWLATAILLIKAFVEAEAGECSQSSDEHCPSK